MDKKKIVVLAGGRSTERDVSLNSGKRIYQALKELGHRAVLVDSFTGLPQDLYDASANPCPDSIFDMDRDWAADIGAIAGESPDIEALKKMDRRGSRGFFGSGVLELCRCADLVFLGLHGEDGENGRVQATLDLMEIPFTGSDYISSALAMDKSLAKELFIAAGVPTARRYGSHGRKLKIEDLEFPCVIKICHGGSSVGVYICHTKEEAEAALKSAEGFQDDVMAEAFIKGREFSVGILEGRALPIIEITPVIGVYDYKNKYQPGAAIEVCPAPLPEYVAEAMQSAAEKAFETLGLRDYARIDFIMAEDESIYALEANSLPGMTATSLLPQEAAVVGIGFRELCERIAELALYH